MSCQANVLTTVLSPMSYSTNVCVVVLVSGAVTTLTSRKERNPNLAETEPLLPRKRSILKTSDEENPEIIFNCIEDDEDQHGPIELSTLIRSIIHIPKQLATLLLVQFLTSTIMFSYFLYFTTFVAKQVFQAEPGTELFTTGEQRNFYKKCYHENRYSRLYRHDNINTSRTFVRAIIPM
eukprot:sb/3471734/